MRASMKVTGVEAVLAQLRYVGEKVPESARKAMHRVADKIVMEARLNTPVDEHNLELSIRKVRKTGFRGRLMLDIEMGGYVNGVNVDIYAMQIHENYDQMGTGQGTIDKRLANPGRYVGEKFLTRALDSVKPKINQEIMSGVMAELPK